MGIIKIAVMSGAAMYGINQLAKATQTRQSNSPAPRRECNDRDSESYRARPPEFRERAPHEPRYVDPPEYQGHGDMYDAQPRQRLYLEDQRPFDRQSYQYVPSVYGDRPQYEPAATMRSPSGPPAQYSYYADQQRPQQQGFVEPEEIFNDPRQLQGGSGGRADMVSMLAQQNMGMGLMGNKKGKKEDKDGKSDLLSRLVRR